MFESVKDRNERKPVGRRRSEGMPESRYFVPSFRPSTGGFRFANSFVHQPLFRLPTPWGGVPIGDASRGLCGGMIFAARDYFEAGLGLPAGDTPPRLGSPLFSYLARRLIDSWNLPGGPFKYYAWMRVPKGDHNKGCARLVWKTCFREWPRVKAELDSGKLSPLGLVRACSKNPWRLGLNHQVLAYGYQADADHGQLAIYVYDPNHPGRDDVTINLGVNARQQSLEVRYSTGEPLRGFFRTRYAFCQPA